MQFFNKLSIYLSIYLSLNSRKLDEQVNLQTSVYCLICHVRSTNAEFQGQHSDERKLQEYLDTLEVRTIPESQCHYHAKQGNEKLHVRERGMYRSSRVSAHLQTKEMIRPIEFVKQEHIIM